jgi:hypothetical protein
MYNLEAEFNPAKRLSDSIGTIEIPVFPTVPVRTKVNSNFLNGLSMSSLRLDKK